MAVAAPHHHWAGLAEDLRRVAMFAGLDDAARAELAAGALWQEYARGAVVFFEGEPARGLGYVAHGWIKAVKISAGGREQVLRYLGPGELFHEASALVERRNPATAIALEPTGLWLLQRATVRALLVANPDLMLRVTAGLMDRISELANLVADLSLRSVEARLARLLLDEAHGTLVVRPQWQTQAELAARLGTVADVLNRALRGLVDAGLVRVARQQIEILDAPGLRARAAAGE